MADSDPVSKFELSLLSGRALAHLGVTTIGQLVQISDLQLYKAAAACAGPDERVAPVLSEVGELLAGAGKQLRSDTPRPIQKHLADDGSMDQARYLGSFHSNGTVRFGERGFVGGMRPAAPETICDLEVAPGIWDVGRDVAREYRVQRLVLQHREASANASWRLHASGVLHLPDPLLAVVDPVDDATVALVGDHGDAIFDRGCTATMSLLAPYTWAAYVTEPDGRLIQRLSFEGGTRS